MGEAKKEKGKVRKWIGNHVVELVVVTGGTLIGAVAGYYGFKVAVDAVTYKMASNAVNVYDYCGMKGACAAVKVLRDNSDEIRKAIEQIAADNPNLANDVQKTFYEITDPKKICEMMFK